MTKVIDQYTSDPDLLHEALNEQDIELESLRKENAALLVALEAENDRDKEGIVCGDCDGSGWLENRVDGRHPCTCMTEAEPYQLLEEERDELTRQLAEYKADAAKWRAYQKRKQEVIAAGMGRKILRDLETHDALPAFYAAMKGATK